jgi:hypothetical protein
VAATDVIASSLWLTQKITPPEAFIPEGNRAWSGEELLISKFITIIGMILSSIKRDLII